MSLFKVISRDKEREASFMLGCVLPELISFAILLPSIYVDNVYAEQLSSYLAELLQEQMESGIVSTKDMRSMPLFITCLVKGAISQYPQYICF